MNDLTEEMLRKATRLLHNTPQPTKKQLLASMMRAMVDDAKERLEFLQGVTALAKACAEEKRADDANPRVPLCDTRIGLRGNGNVSLWAVIGVAGVFYPTKMAAEIAARSMFPDEDSDKRYSRIWYKNFVKED
jgi:hypothetical protein